MEMSQRTVRRISRWITVLCAFALAIAMGITAWATAEPGTTIYVEEGRNEVNIRSQATTNSDPVGKLNGGSAMTVVSVVNSDGYTWYQVECVINGETKTGYIREDLIEIPQTEDPAPSETPEGEGGEGTPEEPAPEGDAVPASAPAGMLFGSLVPLDSGTDPVGLSAEFHPVVMEWNGEQIPAWADSTGEYYILCATTLTSGEPTWYLCDSVNESYVRYKDFMGGGQTSVSSNGGEGVSKTAFIIVIVFCVLLVAATAVMGIKLMNGGGSDDYDDYDDDDDYEDEEEPKTRKNSVFRRSFGEDEDDYEDEEDYGDDYDDRRSGSARQTHQVAVQQGVRTARPVGESRQPVQNRQPVQSRQPAQNRQPVQGRPASQGQGQGRPVNTSRPAGQQGTARPAGQQPARPSSGAAQGQQRYAQRQGGQQRYAQRPTTTRRDDDEY